MFCISKQPKSDLCAWSLTHRREYHDLFAFPLLLPADGKTRGSWVPRMTCVQSEDHEAICLLCTCVFTESSSCVPTTALCKQPTPRHWEQRQVGCRTRSTGETELHCCWSLKPCSPALRCSSPRAWPWPGPLSLLAALLRRGWRALPAGSAVKQLSGQNNQPQEESHAFSLARSAS